MREEAAVDDETRVVVDDEEQLRSHRSGHLREGDEGADQHVGDPAVVRALGLVAAEGALLGGKGLSVQPSTAQLLADRPFGDGDPVTVIEDLGDLGCRAARQLEAERARLGEQLRMRAHRAGVGSRRRSERREPAASIGAHEAVNARAAVGAHRAVRVQVLALGDGAHDGAALGLGEPLVRRLGDHAEAVQRDLFVAVMVHGFGPRCRRERGREA